MNIRRYIALFMFILFTGLMAGNMAGYILCPVAAAADTTLRDCGCDAWFKATNTSADPDGDVRAVAFKTVATETLPPLRVALTLYPFAHTAGYHAVYEMNFPDPLGDAPFRPPIA
jgi:hypothetical protein